MSRMNRRPVGRLVVVPLVALGLVAAACGGDDDDDAAPADTATEETTGGDAGPTTTGGAATTPSDTATDETTAATEETSGDEAPRESTGTIKVGMFLDLIGGTTFDPALSVTISDEIYLRHIYGTLLKRFPDGSYEPWMAESYEVVDPQTVRVTLRDGVEFSDGAPYDADAVRAGMLRTKNEASEEAARGQQNLFKTNLEDIVVVDPLTVEFKLNAPVAGQFLAVLSGRESMVPSPTADPAALATSPVGAGPFVLDTFVPEQQIFMNKNETYFGDDYTFGRLELYQTPPGTQRTNALLSGTVDVIEDVDVTSLSAFDDGPYDTRQETSEFGYRVLQPCPTKPPLDNVDVRRAISMAIDREKIVELTNGGVGEPASDLWPSDHPYYNPDLGDIWGYHPEEAKELMDSTGVGNITVESYVPINYPWEQMNEVIRTDLAEIGVDYVSVPSQNVLADFVEAQKPGFLLVPGSRVGVDKYLRYYADDAAQNICKGDYNATIVEPANAIAGLDPSDPAVAAGFREIDQYIADNVLLTPLIFDEDLFAWNTDRLGGELQVAGNSYTWDLSGMYVNE
ncbi:MAG: ABC transporter substrate-binding protein [Ilumatobacteraceae bacterium]